MKKHPENKKLINSSNKEGIKSVVKKLIKENLISEEDIRNLLLVILEFNLKDNEQIIENEKKKIQKLKEDELYERFVEELMNFKTKIYGILEKSPELTEKFSKEFNNLREKFPNIYSQCLVYHILALSTFYKDEIQYLDFPNEDSLIKRIIQLLNEHSIEINRNI